MVRAGSVTSGPSEGTGSPLQRQHLGVIELEAKRWCINSIFKMLQKSADVKATLSIANHFVIICEYHNANAQQIKEWCSVLRSRHKAMMRMRL